MDYSWVKEFFVQEKSQHQMISGYYNHNYIVEHGGTKYVIRVPINNMDTMDYRLIPEKVVLQYLEELRFPAPRILYSDPDGKFSIHSFIAGENLNHIFYDSALLPDWIPKYLAKQIEETHHFDTERFQKYCLQLGISPNSKQFYFSMLKKIKSLYRKYATEYKHLYRQLLFPDDPFAAIQEDLYKLRQRDFVFSHCDIHRKNLILNPNSRKLVILDWELVLIADPAYDLSVHFHKMRYHPEQEKIFIQHYLKHTEHFKDQEELLGQISIYRKLEQVKSACVDSIRYVKDLKDPNLSADVQMDYAVRYYNKLRKAWSVWGIDGDTLLNPRQILYIFLSF